MGLENPLHILLLLLVVLLVFGAKRLPELGRSLGEGMRGFKDSISGTGTSSDQIPPQTSAPVQVSPVPPSPAAPAPPSPGAPQSPPVADPPQPVAGAHPAGSSDA